MTGLRDFTERPLRLKPGDAAAYLRNVAAGQRSAAELGGVPSAKFLRTALVEDGLTADARKRSDHLDQRIREAAGMALKPEPEPEPRSAKAKGKPGTRGGGNLGP
jgi:hypothetical protein